ncbi:50S ribosomal protein L23 [Candidatus Parcubacteria bacterium]|nr:MAG: 50S ribosomal protein L23 [Candidatus Parcubacteria bacterium]
MASSYLIHPLITEKSTTLSQAGQYVFVVDARATKNEIKKEVERLYHVNVKKVNIARRPAKVRRLRGLRGRRPGYKKAIVVLEKGQHIEIGV